MKNLTRILSILLLAFSCNEDEQNNPNQDYLEPSVTEAGIPIGPAVTKEIGHSGGSITSDDGVLDVIVPSGAVNANTTFSIQPITNFCPGGMFAYRLLPEGLTFADPVTLVFHYTDEDIAGTLPEFLGVAYQGADKIWYSLPGAEVDEVSKTISVEVKHFTDWTAITELEIDPAAPPVPELRVNETIGLSVSGISFFGEEYYLPPLPVNPPDNPSPDEDYLPPLPQRQPFRTIWFVNGVENGDNAVGSITFQEPSADRNIYTYKAPASVPAGNPVLISAEITGLRQWTFVAGNPRITTHNKVILFKRIKIIDEFDFKLKVESPAVNFQCTLQQSYYDSAQMDVHVAGEVVTISNIVNQAASIIPETVSLGEGCTTTCIGGVGKINISSGTGELSKESGKQELYIALLNAGAVLPGTKLICNGNETSVPPPQLPDDSYLLIFDLQDSTQQVIDGVYAKFTLTPK